jgi:hypothetical protein
MLLGGGRDACHLLLLKFPHSLPLSHFFDLFFHDIIMLEPGSQHRASKGTKEEWRVVRTKASKQSRTEQAEQNRASCQAL